MAVNEATYSHYYEFSYSSIGASIYGDASVANLSVTLEDSNDGSDDGSVNVSQDVSLSETINFGSTANYQGLTDAGDPIFTINGKWFVFSDDASLAGTVGLNATTWTMCFATGTLIATPDGERCVEDLRIGDLVKNQSGQSIPVKWIGKQTYSSRFGMHDNKRPVCITSGALGNGLPHQDLTVTADHAVLVEGVFCNAGALVNDTTIIRVPLAEMGEVFTVYHVETDAHEIIMANGAPAETFIDNASRRAFNNFAEYSDLYGDEAEMQELSLPRAMSARQVPAHIKRKLAGCLAA